MANPLWGPLNAAYFTLDPTVANADEQAWLDQNRNPQPIDPLNENKFDPNEYGLRTVKNDQTFQPESGATLQEMLADRDLQLAAQPSLSQADSPLSFQYQNEEYPNRYGKSELYDDRQGPFSDKRQVADPNAYYEHVRSLGTEGDPFLGARDDTDAPFAQQSGDYYAGDYVNYNEPFQRPGTYEWEKGWDPTGSSMDTPYEVREYNPMLMEALIRQKQNNLHGVPQNLGFKEESETISTPLDMERFAGVSELGRNDEDVEQVEYLGSPSKFQNFKSRIDDGLGSFRNKASQGWDFAQQLPGMAMGAMTGIPGIGALMGALGNAFEDRTLGTSNVVDEYGNVHSSADLNKQNARGGGYTEAARSSRRARARLNNVLARKAAGKKYGNLDELLEISRKQQELDNRGYKGTPGGNTGSGAFAKFDNTSKNYGPHTKGGGNQGGGFSGAGAGTGSRGARSRDGGIIMDKNFYANGGLATLFARRG